MKEIDDYLGQLPAWQSKELTALRALIHATEPAFTEDWKWAVPVYTYKGKILIAMSGFKGHVKLNFLTGAGLDDQGAFNGGLDSKTHRSINVSEGESFATERVAALIGDAVRKADGE